MTISARVRAARDLHRFLDRERTRNTAAPGAGRDEAAVRLATAETLDGLRRVLPFDCATIGTWNAATGRHTLLAEQGLPTYLVPWTESKQSLNPRFVVVERGGVPLRQTDVPPRQLWDEELFQVFLHPHGLHDGFAVCLWTDDGRPVGTLTVDTIRRFRIDDVALDLAVMLGPSLAALLDPVPPLRPLSADLADDGTDVLAVTGTGRVRALTAGADVDLARRAGPLQPMIHAALGPGRSCGSVLLLAGNRVLAVSVEAATTGVLVLHRTVDAPFGLSIRELEILDGLGGGATNAALAARFGITPRTVATYVERLLAKTGCPNRTAAARLAARLKLVTTGDSRPAGTIRTVGHRAGPGTEPTASADRLRDGRRPGPPTPRTAPAARPRPAAPA